METKSNNIWVGAVTLILLGISAAFIVWMVGFSSSQQNQYDIFFKTSVAGLAKGSPVVYAGVPAGQVKEISLWHKDPEFVRVRIAVDEGVPILQGTTATIQGIGFTGVSQIQLEGALKGAPPITDVGPEGVPVIPTKPGALGQLLNSAPQLLERLSTLAENLNILLDEENQESISGILKNTDTLSGELAKQAPQLEQVMKELTQTLKSASAAADKLGGAAGSAQTLMDKEGAETLRSLRQTMAKAEAMLEALDGTLKAAQPGLNRISEKTLPETEALIREMRKTARALSALTEKIDHEGAGSLLGEPPLPDYKP